MEFSASSLVDSGATVSFGSLGKVQLPIALETLPSMFTKYGLFTGNNVALIIDALLTNKTGRAWTTFAQLHALTGKVLRIPVTCLTCGGLRWLDKDTAPDMPVAKACQASSTFPVVFQPLRWEGELYVDGGFLEILPKKAFKGRARSNALRRPLMHLICLLRPCDSCTADCLLFTAAIFERLPGVFCRVKILFVSFAEGTPGAAAGCQLPIAVG